MAHRKQSYKEEIANAITHGIGILFGLTATVFLLIKGIKSGDPWVISGFMVYAFGMTLSYVTSTLYHSSRNESAKLYLRKWDHSAIFIHIAGTYTPFTLILLRQVGWWGWSLFTVVWLIALVGILYTFRKMKDKSPLKTIAYIAMGSVIVVAIKPMIQIFEGQHMMEILYWLIGGGACYVVGAVFYSFDKVKYIHTVWHLFVLGGSVSHCIAIYKLV
ncbi:MAG: hemolysin III family protein [Parabacteroides sp.]|jgi:hemolysin III|uniref:Hemolysin III n=1 Tax=Parabacteroides chartae TaxID=1037355 RepID=A0A1T5C2T8_9BACT|nr:hemolysin III family protein [Parabacteroides chartae]MDD3508398.1 hemolysin III family protein [Parabacteroides sp.]SKB53878.1 hemolysin III [Parabacteroides chartae]